MTFSSVMVKSTTFTSLRYTVANPDVHHQVSHRDDVGTLQKMQEIMEHTSTGRGILIGMVSASGFAVIIGLTIAIVYFFRNTHRGRILLDRMGRPGQFDDEQAMLREEAEALETMDDMQRAEYMRAKGELSDVISLILVLTVQPSYKRIHQNPFRLIFRYLNFWRYKRRAFLLGNSSLSLRLRIASFKQELRLSSSIRSAAFKVICLCLSKTRCTIGRRRYTRSQRLRF